MGGLTPELWRVVHRIPTADVWEDYVMDKVNFWVLLRTHIRHLLTSPHHQSQSSMERRAMQMLPLTTMR